MTAAPPPLAYATLPDAYDPDAEHLRVLAIFHFIVGPLEILFGCFPIIHLVIGVLILTGRLSNVNPPDRWIGLAFVLIPGLMILSLWALGGMTLYSGIQLRKRRRRTLSLIVGGFNCLIFPFGTVLGVFTLVVLLRRSVEDLYRRAVDRTAVV